MPEIVNIWKKYNKKEKEKENKNSTEFSLTTLEVRKQ